MRLNSKGQVTIPADLRRKHHLLVGDEVEVVEDGDGYGLFGLIADELTVSEWSTTCEVEPLTAELQTT